MTIFKAQDAWRPSHSDPAWLGACPFAAKESAGVMAGSHSIGGLLEPNGNPPNARKQPSGKGRPELHAMRPYPFPDQYAHPLSLLEKTMDAEAVTVALKQSERDHQTGDPFRRRHHNSENDGPSPTQCVNS